MREGCSWSFIRELTAAHFKKANQGTILGAAWSLLNPIAMLAILLFLFRPWVGRTIPNFPLYLILGIISFNYFTSTINSTIGAFRDNRDLVINSTVPNMCIVVSYVAFHTGKFFIELIVSIMLISLTTKTLAFLNFSLVLLCAAMVLFLLGIGFFVSIAAILVGDLRYIWGLITRMLFFLTPIFYSLDIITQARRAFLYFCNPLIPFLGCLRGVLLDNGSLYVRDLGFFSLYAVSIFLFGWVVFQKYSKRFVELL